MLDKNTWIKKLYTQITALSDEYTAGRVNACNRAREMGGTAYKNLLGILCAPSLEVKFWDSQNNSNAIQDGFIFTRDTSAYTFGADGYMYSIPAGTLRHEWDSSTGEYKGVLIEAASTNLLTYSQDYSNAIWVKSNSSTMSTTAEVAPDNSSTVYKLTEDSITNTAHYISHSFTATLNSKYCYSIFIKPIERTKIKLEFSSSQFSTANNAYFNLSSGTVTSGSGGLIQALSNGWYKCSVFATCSTGGSATVSVTLVSTADNIIYDGDGSSGVYIWNSQLEIGVAPTSVITTTNVTATRSADNLSIATSAFPYNSKEGTIFVNFTQLYPNANAASGKWLCSLDNGSSDFIGLTVDPTNKILGQVYTSSTYQTYTTLVTSVTNNTEYRTSLSYKINNTSVSVNGSTPVVDTICTMPASATSLRIGQGRTQTFQANGYIKHIIYFPRKLSDTELQLLTR